MSKLETSAATEIDTPCTCFGCGQANADGLRMRFETFPDGVSVAHWQPMTKFEGYRGIIHGGVVSTVLDEAMSKAVAACGCQALTAELRVRFRRPVPSGENLVIRAWVVDRNRRRFRTEGTISDSNDRELAHGWATFLVPFDGLNS